MNGKTQPLINLLVLILFSCWAPAISMAQVPEKTLQADEVLAIVRQYHPVALQAALGIEDAQAELKMAKGGFDPRLGGYFAGKTFDGTKYYQQGSQELTIPTWFGVDLHGGFQQLSGNRLDPSQTKGQTSFLGISLPIAKGLMMDKRRAALQQAKLYRNLSQTEQRATINNLLLVVMEDYWQWIASYQSYLNISSIVEINTKRLELVTASYAMGERAAIDTVEAMAQLKLYQNLQTQSWLQFQNSGLQLSAHLWGPNAQPYDLSDEVKPPVNWDQQLDLSLFELNGDNLLSAALANHPELQAYEYKMDMLEVNRKLKFQELLPKADLRYNFLSKGNSLIPNEYFDNNYQYGFKFEMPLRLSYGRGAYRQAKIKIESTQLAQIQKIRDIEIKIRAYLNDYGALKSQIAVETEQLALIQRLVAAEQMRFSNGESSLFLVNSRENKALEVQQKLLTLKSKYFKTLYALQSSAGLLL
ncbi:outer membrane protein TolC [Dyadobacter jejuensis]|uniref:Outer membrane protein TolC n=1 Tax=Dyadobacter jejuensis TaxID=1082580 RepID=A0A316AK78_9BACT|nr:TolC family protein [Dyadobacter jejuensis]PWJ57778.1 outer membrane protein TolC [Dyadobacter jejuensis]